MCVFFKDGRSSGGGGRGSSSWGRRGSGVGVGSGSGLGASSASARVLCVPAAVRREPLHDRVRCLQGLVPRQVNKPLSPAAVVRGRRPAASAAAARVSLGLGRPRRAPRPQIWAPNPRAGRRREQGVPGCPAGCAAEPVGSAGPGEESPQQTGTKGPAEKLAGEARARGRGGRRDSSGGGAQAGPQPVAPTALAAAGHRAPSPGRPERLPSPATAPASLPGGRLSVRPRVAPSAGPVAPPSLFIKLPRAAGRGAGRRVNRATVEGGRHSRAREVRGPVTAQLGRPPAHPPQHTPLPAGGRRRRPSPASPSRRASNFTRSAVSGDTGTARSGGPGAAAGQLWGGAVADIALGRRRRAAGLTFRRARAASAARPPTRVFCNQSVRLIKGGATAS